MTITHYKVVMFKIVVTCAFPKTYAVKVHLLWLQNFYVFLKLKCSLLKVTDQKSTIPCM